MMTENDEIKTTLRIFVVEDRREVREALETFLRAVGDLEHAGSFMSVEAALPALDSLQPDVILCDISLPGVDGIEGVRLFRQKLPDVRVIMLTIFDDDARITAAIANGADGYLLKHSTGPQIIAAIREAAAGGAPLTPSVARRVLELFRNVPPLASSAHDLTPHEQRVLRLLVDGHSYQSASEKLGVSVNTFAFHIKNIYQKLQVHSKSQAVAKALRDGIV